MVEQKTNFRKDSADYFRRFPLCAFREYPKCDAPCEYSPTNNEPSRVTLDAAAEYISALVIGNSKNIFNLGNNLRSVIQARMEHHYPEGFVSGHRHCALIQLSSQATQRFVHAHPLAENWEAVIVLQCELVSLWEQLWLKQLPPISKLQQLNKLILTQITPAPGQMKPGCRQCRVRCLFGHRFQADDYPAVQAFAEQLRGSRPEVINAEKISEWAVQAIETSIRPNLHKYAGYCLLTQATSNGALLSSYIQSMLNNNKNRHQEIKGTEVN
jgi:hypothetical protein